MCKANLDWLEFGRITDKQSLIKYWIQSKWKKKLSKTKPATIPHQIIIGEKTGSFFSNI